MFWSLFFIISKLENAKIFDRYVPIASFDDRISCENAIISQSELILTFGNTNVSVTCIKTDERVNSQFGAIQEKHAQHRHVGIGLHKLSDIPEDFALKSQAKALLSSSE